MVNAERFDKEKSNVLKGVAILLLLFHHIFLEKERLIANGVVLWNNLYDKFHPVVVAARICVWIFVFISAYGLTVKYESGSKSVGQFIAGCWLNLMRQWWIVLIVMSALYQLFVGNIFEYYGYSLQLWILDVFEWHDLFGQPRILGSWYLCLAQLIILFIPMFSNFCRKYGLFSLAVFYVISLFTGEGIVSTGGGTYWQYIPTVIGGVVAAQNGYLDKLLQREDKLWKNIFECAILMAGIVVLSLLRTKMTNVNYFGGMLVFVIVFMLCILFAKYFRYIHGILRFFGKHSAVIFMTNVFFYVEFPQVIYFTGNPIISYLTLIAVTLSCSIAVKYLCEKTRYNKFFSLITRT